MAQLNVDADFAVRSGTTDKFTVASSTGNINTSGNLTVNGNTDLGNASTDTITMTAHVDSDIVPSGTTRDLGGASAKWRDGYFTGTLYATALSGITSISANVTGNLTGNADSATQLYVTDTTTNADFRVLFATAGGTGAN